MKKYLSRKLVAFIVTNAILLIIFLVGIRHNGDILTPSTLTMLMLFVVLNGVTYIGGKALETWSKSRFFRAELVDK